jgi:hypothetical protein
MPAFVAVKHNEKPAVFIIEPLKNMALKWKVMLFSKKTISANIPYFEKNEEYDPNYLKKWINIKKI